MTALLAFLILLAGGLVAVTVPIFTSPDYVALYGPVSVLDASQAVLLCILLASAFFLVLTRFETQDEFLMRLFLGALLVRMLVGTAIFIFNCQAFFGGDAYTYDAIGTLQLKGWSGDFYSAAMAYAYVNKTGTAWGMIYFVAGVYGLIGRNMLAIQLVNAVVGAATAPLIFLSARIVFENTRVARLAALGVAFMPSLVLWSSQGLKDGPIMFFLALSILATLKLGQKFRLNYLLVLIGALLCVLAFRFYVFYMLVPAIAGTLLIGSRTVTALSVARQFVLVLFLGVMMTMFGAIMGSRRQFDAYSSLQAVQVSRQDAATTAGSGFGKDLDVSTAGGAVSAVPVGLVYLLFAPFPWQLGSARQAITMPEMLVWWASFPVLVVGFFFSIKYRLRQVLPILMFTIMLTLAYSVFQGNIGNAYRQRAQLLIFYFIFAAVGYTLIREKKRERSSASASEVVYVVDSPESQWTIEREPLAKRFDSSQPLQRKARRVPD